MSATNLDLPVLISAEQIRRREFVTIRRGYDPDQVRAYLGQLADQVELMRILLRDAQAEAETSRRTPSQPRQDPYQLLGERVASVIREADHVAETITSEAHRNADDLTREARADADRIRTDAQAKAEEARSRAEHAVRTAREEADRTIAGLSTRRDALVDQIASMQERLIGVARDLESAMDVQFTIPDIPAIRDLLDEPAEGTPADENGTPPTVAPSGDAGDDAADPIEVEASAVREPAIAVTEAGDEEPRVLDPFYEELWEGTGAMQLDIPALDLDWGDIDDEGDDPPPYA
jgi:DivIVA domain-containing protein